MEKEKITRIILHSINKRCEGKEILSAMETAITEMEVARSLFNNATDGRLIEVAIYSEQVAKKRYDYLLKIAKDKGLTVSNDYVIDQCSKLAE